MVARRWPFFFGSLLGGAICFLVLRCACGDFCQSVAGRVHRGAKCGTPSRPLGPDDFLVGLAGLVAGMVNAPWFLTGESGDHNELSIKNHFK